MKNYASRKDVEWDKLEEHEHFIMNGEELIYMKKLSDATNTRSYCAADAPPFVGHGDEIMYDAFLPAYLRVMAEKNVGKENSYATT